MLEKQRCRVDGRRGVDLTQGRTVRRSDALQGDVLRRRGSVLVRLVRFAMSWEHICELRRLRLQREPE